MNLPLLLSKRMLFVCWKPGEWIYAAFQNFWKWIRRKERAFNQPGLNIDTTGGQHQVEDLILFSRQENNACVLRSREIRQRNTDILIS